ncbi:MarR family winged helix-turn-helix transcriptional regulator [Streptomyces sp. NPDC085479]|uniref:MarR family winged helix-turn-helix transcriptional regulator n=1 Tax=Streptomyces sp. NPDC085479 TaxID=3365726 RepID=UPI0037D935C6
MYTPSGWAAFQWPAKATPSSLENESLRALASRCDKSKLVLVLDELEAAGLVARRPDPADRRARIVEATDDGRRVLDAARDDVRAIEDSLLSDLEPAARQALRTVLGRLVGAPVTRIEDGRAYDDACAPRQA